MMIEFRANLENLEKELIFKKQWKSQGAFLKIYTDQGKVREKYFMVIKKIIFSTHLIL